MACLKSQTLRGVALAALVAGGIAACGGGGEVTDADNSAAKFSGEERDAAQAVEDFSSAVAAGDWSRICDELFTADQAELTAGIIGDTCESEIEDSFAGNRELNLTVEKVETSGPLTTGADAIVFSSDDDGNHQSWTILDERGDWRIDSYGGTFGAD